MVRVTSLLEEELPLSNAINMIRKTAPPTTQTQGWVYQSVEVVVVVSLVTDTLELDPPVLSCAHSSTCVIHSANSKNTRWAKDAIDCFMLVSFDKLKYRYNRH